MKRFVPWLVEVQLVLEHSHRAFGAWMLALVGPAIVFAIGIWALASVDASGEFQSIVLAVTQKLVLVHAVLMMIFQFKIGARAATIYRREKTSLLGF